jgi:hypothetical protein
MPRLDKQQLKMAERNAKRIGVTVKPAKNLDKKLDVFRGDKKIASIGSANYEDYLQHRDEERRRLYRIRHQKYRTIKGTPSYYSDQILWN